VIAVSVRPELQTVGFAPQRRSADDCYALAGEHQILRRADALGASRSLALGGPQTDSSSVRGGRLAAKAAPAPNTNRRNLRSR